MEWLIMNLFGILISLLGMVYWQSREEMFGFVLSLFCLILNFAAFIFIGLNEFF